MLTCSQVFYWSLLPPIKKETDLELFLNLPSQRFHPLLLKKRGGGVASSYQGEDVGKFAAPM